MRRLKRSIIVAFIVLAAGIFSGCLSTNIDSLLSLPQPSEEYLDLQKRIDEVISSGASYSAPTSGSYRQSVQLYDINGDGVNEALAFLNVSGEKPLKIYIYKNINGKYENAAIIEGDGTEIDSISYTDMNGDGWREIIVGWKMGADIQMLNVYSLKGFSVSSIAATDYTEYINNDIDADGSDELLVIRRNSAESSLSVMMFSVSGEGDTEISEARLSQGAENVSKVTIGGLTGGVQALFVESLYDGTGMITDIFISNDGRLENISDDENGVSQDTVRYYTVYCRDINNDGIVEIPIPHSLYAQGEASYRTLEWYAFSAKGGKTLALTTYHNYSDSWYLVLPSSWRDRITVRREDTISGERAVVFSVWNGEDSPVSDFLKIYALSGENRAEAATRGNRQLIRREDEVIYAAELLTQSEEWEYIVDFQYLRDNFYMIYSEWVTGLT